MSNRLIKLDTISNSALDSGFHYIYKSYINPRYIASITEEEVYKNITPRENCKCVKVILISGAELLALGTIEEFLETIDVDEHKSRVMLENGDDF